jgi:hypothetical protein
MLLRNVDSNITYILMHFDLSTLIGEREFSFVCRNKNINGIVPHSLVLLARGKLYATPFPPRLPSTERWYIHISVRVSAYCFLYIYTLQWNSPENKPSESAWGHDIKSSVLF